MTTARELMTADPAFCDQDVTVEEAARQMADENIGALPVCSTEGRLTGVVTDRDLAVRVVAEDATPPPRSRRPAQRQRGRHHRRR